MLLLVVRGERWPEVWVALLLVAMVVTRLGGPLEVREAGAPWLAYLEQVLEDWQALV